MKFSTIFLAYLPSALAASLAYNPPARVQTMAKLNPADCYLPNTFHISNFKAHSRSNSTTHAVNGTASAVTSFKFTYINDVTNATTTCRYQPGIAKGRQAWSAGNKITEISCKAKDVSFVWSAEKSQITIIQKVCSGTDGKHGYAAYGSVSMPVTCSRGKCQSRQPTLKGTFSKMTPVSHIANASNLVADKDDTDALRAIDTAI